MTLLQLYTLRIRQRLQGQLLLLQTGIYTVYLRLFYFSSIGAKRKNIRFLPCGRQMNSALVGQGRLCVAPFQSMNNEQPVPELFLGWADWCICGRVRTNTNGDRHPKICLFQNVSDSFSNLAKERWFFFFEARDPKQHSYCCYTVPTCLYFRCVPHDTALAAPRLRAHTGTSRKKENRLRRCRASARAVKVERRMFKNHQ